MNGKNREMNGKKKRIKGGKKEKTKKQKERERGRKKKRKRMETDIHTSEATLNEAISVAQGCIDDARDKKGRFRNEVNFL